MSFKIKIEGLDDLLTKVKTMPKEIQDDVDIEMGATATDIDRVAKQRAPVDLGRLKNGISHGRVKQMTWEIVSDAPYSAYVNWGTINKVKVEPGWAEFAAMFKGKGIRKTGGIKPTFFFTSAVDQFKPILIKRIKDVINK